MGAVEVWGKVDELVASWARPYSIYVCSTAVAIAVFFPATAAEALPLAAGLAGGAAYLRTMDKQTAAAAVSPAATAANKPTVTG